ncbi:MAG: immunity 50 family protein [Gammaproteobacteria bacterium]|nr:immunity 50 family protein [Gammaproteobacteria bacterium]
MINNKEKVTDIFGYWPEFCDVKIKEVHFQDLEKLYLVIFYIDCEQGKRAEITITFSDLSNVLLSDLMSDNVIDLLSISETAPYNIEIEACCGLNGTFTCSNIAVTDVSA